MAEWLATRPIFDVCVRDIGYKGGGAPGYVVDAEGSRRPYKFHGRSNFGRSKGTAAIGILQV